MVVPAFSNTEIVAVIAVDIVGTVFVIGWIKRAHACWTTQNFIGQGQTLKSVPGIEQFGSNDHCNSKIRSKLIVPPFLAGFVEIFIDPASIDSGSVNIILRILQRVFAL